MHRTIAATVIAATIALTGTTVVQATETSHRHPRFLTTPCELEDSNNCYWDAGNAGNGGGHSFYAIPVGADKVAVVYWQPRYNRRHGYVTTR